MLLDVIVVILMTTEKSSNFLSLNHVTQTDLAEVASGLDRFKRVAAIRLRIEYK